MSPIPSGSIALALSPTPSVADTSGQPTFPQSHYWIGAGGLLFVMVAIVSVGSYLFRWRGKSSRANDAKVSGPGLFSSLRHRGSRKTNGDRVASERSIDVEAGLDHVSMVYTIFFHPITWSKVECHPATSAAPEILVEDEAEATPASQPNLLGTSSLRHAGGDGGDDGENGVKPAREEPNRGGRPRARRLPSYDFSGSTHVTFTSDVIGTTTRPGAFLSVPGGPENVSSEDWSEGMSPSSDNGALVTEPCSCCASLRSRQGPSSSDLELEVACEAYNRILTVNRQVDELMPYDACSGYGTRIDVSSGTSGAAAHLHTTSEDLSDSLSFDSDVLPYAGIKVTPPRQVEQHSSQITSTGATGRRTPLSPAAEGPEEDSSGCIWSASDPDCFPSPDDGVLTARRSSSTARRFGMADMSDFAKSLREVIPEERDDLLPVISALLDHFSYLMETDRATSCTSLDWVDPVDEPTSSSGAQGIYDGEEDYLSEAATSAVVRHGQDVMQSILEDIDDFELECSAPSFSEDSSDHSGDEDNTSVPGLGHTSGLDNTEGGSLNPPGFIETDRVTSCRAIDQVDQATSSTRDISVQNCDEDLPRCSNYPAALTVLHEGQDIMRRILEELRDFELDLGLRSHSEDSDCSDEDTSVPNFTPMSDPDSRRDSLESGSSTPAPDSDVSEEGAICPYTPPAKSPALLATEPNVHEVRKPSLVPTLPAEEVYIALLKSSDSPPSPPCKAYVRTHRDNRSLWYGPQFPLVALPRL